jgi:hypothetical protein
MLTERADTGALSGCHILAVEDENAIWRLTSSMHSWRSAANSKSVNNGVWDVPWPCAYRALGFKQRADAIVPFGEPPQLAPEWFLPWESQP